MVDSSVNSFLKLSQADISGLGLSFHHITLDSARARSDIASDFFKNLKAQRTTRSEDTEIIEIMRISVCFPAENGTSSKRNFHLPESNCGMALNWGCRAFTVLQLQLRHRIRARRQLTDLVWQTRKKYSNLSFQESDFSPCHSSQAFEERHFTKRKISPRRALPQDTTISRNRG